MCSAGYPARMVRPLTVGGRRLVGALRAAPLSTALMTANVAAFAATATLGGSGDGRLLRAGALERSRVWAGEPWRLLTAAFLHVDAFHLACNVAFGLLVCRVVEQALGARRTLALYLASALGGSALSLLGQDGTSAGASGALFGMIGVVLALHRRAAGGWRPFLASRATRSLVVGLVVTSAAASLVLPLDHLCHLGGLVTGAALAWLLTRPLPASRWPWPVACAALAALVVAAAWPRAGLTRLQRAELERDVHDALVARDTAKARGLVARAAAAGHDSERLAAYRATLLVQEGDLEGALEAARPLRASADGAVRAEGDRIVAGVAKVLAYRAYTGDGAPRNPWRGLSLMEEACGAGDGESCRNVARVRGDPP